MDEIIQRLDREHVYKGAIIDVYRDKVLIPGGREEYFDFIGHKGAAAVVPVLPDGRIVMVRQYRNALDRFTIEIPAGGLDHVGEPYIDAARRELREETGYSCDDLEPLITVNTTVAFCNEIIPVYVAFIKGERKEQELDDDEFVNVEYFTIDELMDKIYKMEITDSKTIASLMAYKNKYVK